MVVSFHPTRYISEPEVNIEKIRLADLRIRNSIYRTPLVRSSFLSESTGAEFYLKLENLQLTRSFKIRGAVNKIAKIGLDSQATAGIITASAGNHGQAVALCASRFGLRAKVVVPETTPKVKSEAIKQYGAELVLHGAIYDDAERYARELEEKEGLTFVSPYNDPEIIAGQGTIALEILEQQIRDLDVLIVPVGGGGLASGIAVGAKSLRPNIRLIGVQSEASPSMYESLLSGRLVDVRVEDSIAEGLIGNIEQGSITFGYVRKYVDRVVLVKEDTIKKAIRVLWQKDGQAAEGSGAASVAVALQVGEERKSLSEKRVAAVVSGGNIDFSELKGIVEE